MTTGKCAGCLGSGTCWVCLGTGYANPECRLGVCSRCKGTTSCHLCQASNASAGSVRTRRVLVVDDEPDVANLVEFWLEDDARCAGVDIATTGEAAFLPLAESEPDTIVFDHRLGEHNSVDYLPGIRSAAPDSRVIIYTADPTAAQADGVLEHGADLIIDKSRMKPAELLDAALEPEPPPTDE